MKTQKEKQIITEKSSKKVGNFLERTGLHKKDFAETTKPVFKIKY